MSAATRPPRRPRVFAIVAIGALLAAGAAALYGRSEPGNSPAAQCQPSMALADRLKPLARGEVAGVVVPKEPRALPVLSFEGPDGAPMTLAEFKGRTVLFNLWATWCVPCRTEMPALDRLEATLGGPDFAVVAVSIDARDRDKPRKWLKDNNVTRLAPYADPEGRLLPVLRSVGRALGLPTTLIVDRDGCMVAHLDGPAEWASQDALALIRAAIR